MTEYTDNQICLLALTKVRAQFQLGTNRMHYLCPSLRWELRHTLGQWDRSIRLDEQLRAEIGNHLYGYYTVESYILATSTVQFGDEELLSKKARTFRLELLDKLVADYAALCGKEERPCLT